MDIYYYQSDLTRQTAREGKFAFVVSRERKLKSPRNMLLESESESGSEEEENGETRARVEGLVEVEVEQVREDYDRRDGMKDAHTNLPNSILLSEDIDPMAHTPFVNCIEHGAIVKPFSSEEMALLKFFPYSDSRESKELEWKTALEVDSELSATTIFKVLALCNKSAEIYKKRPAKYVVLTTYEMEHSPTLKRRKARSQ